MCRSKFLVYVNYVFMFFFFKQKTAYEMRISDWSSDVCSSDLMVAGFTVIPFISPYFVQNVGMTEMELVYNYLVGGACTFVSSQYIGKLADKYGKRQLLVVLCVLSIIPILLVTHLGETSLPLAVAASRSAERRVGKGCVSTCRSRWVQ